MWDGVGKLSGLRKETVRVVEANDKTARLQKTVQFQSWLKAGDQPRFSFNSRSEILFDRAAGMLQSARIEGESVHARANSNQRIPVSRLRHSDN